MGYGGESEDEKGGVSGYVHSIEAEKKSGGTPGENSRKKANEKVVKCSLGCSGHVGLY